MRNPLQQMIEGQLGNMSRNIAQAMQELEATELEGSAGGGAVRVKITGVGEVIGVEIAPTAMEQGDVELLQDLVCAAVRDAIAKALDVKRKRVMEATPLGNMGLELPDVF
jgi:nucleoid-associated protein EbfC